MWFIRPLSFPTTVPLLRPFHFHPPTPSAFSAPSTSTPHPLLAAPAAAAATHATAAAGPRLTDAGKQVPVGNGGVAASYHWTQTLYEVN